MKRRNYQSDFVARMVLPQGVEGADFDIEFATNGIAVFRASRKGAVHVNCKTCDDGSVLVIFKNHGLQAGFLRSKFVSFLVNGDMPDGVQKCVTPRMQEVELVVGAGDDCGEVDFDIAVDYAVINAYDMAVKAGYIGTREEYIKMISSKPATASGEILRHKCISYYSPRGEVYTGNYMRFPGVVGDVFDMSRLMPYLDLVVGDNDLSDNGSGRNGAVRFDGTSMTITHTDCSGAFVRIDKDIWPFARFSSTGKLEVGAFAVAARSLGNKIVPGELCLVYVAVEFDTYNSTPGLGSEAQSIEVQIWKKVRRHHSHRDGRAITGVRKRQWVTVATGGTAFGKDNLRSRGYKFLIRARRVNSRRNAFGEWQKFHAEWDGVRFKVETSRSDGREANKIIPTGRLAIETAGDTRLMLNGKVFMIVGAGYSEHIVPGGSTLTLDSDTVIGIHRFDGVIYGGFMRKKIQFVKNTTVMLTNTLCYEAERLTDMDGCRILVDDGVKSSYGLWRSSGIAVAPYFDCAKVPSIGDIYYGCKNLVSASYLDTSNVTDFKNMFYGCDSLVAVPLYDTSQATSIHGMFGLCANLQALPKFNFANVTNGTGAFTLCGSITEFPDYFNFGKLVTAPYIFGGDWGFYNEQKDTYVIGSLRRFPAYSLPEAVDLTGAWLDQSKLYSLGKINMPKCTKLDSAFKGCFNLTSVGGFTGLMCNIDMAHCSKLTVASLVAIMTEAADVKALGARTMTLGAVNLAKLSDAQKAVAVGKGWSLA